MLKIISQINKKLYYFFGEIFFNFCSIGQNTMHKRFLHGIFPNCNQTADRKAKIEKFHETFFTLCVDLL